MKRRIVVVLLLVTAGLLVLWPPGPRRFPARPDPAAGYDEALRRVATEQAREGPEVSPECRSRLMTHGARAARAVVLLHGLTNCPEQFRLLGERLYERGANVYVPRLPQHGLADRMTTALARLDAPALQVATDRAVDVARGLGDSVIVVGLCIGGTMAAWAAQERADVARAVVIAPLQGLALARGPLTRPAMRLLLALPNLFVWWDAREKADLPGPRHVYPRFATRSVAEGLLLGAAVEADARRVRPAAASIAVVTVATDAAVDNGAAARLVSLWRAHGARVATHEFPARARLNHDIIDPEQVGANPALVYPVLIELIAP
jgi:alpha-beta hydrolase superfamily lysophospholipase